MLKQLVALLLLVTSLGACTSARLAGPATGHQYEVSLRRLLNDRLLMAAVVIGQADEQAAFVIPKIVLVIYGVMNFGQHVTDFVTLDHWGHDYLKNAKLLPLNETFAKVSLTYQPPLTSSGFAPAHASPACPTLRLAYLTENYAYRKFRH